jgi:transcriptional/translational regulatory protein YebC/TACO1
MGAQWKAKGKDLAANAKGRMFGKLAKDIMVAARNGADPAANSRLRMVMEHAGPRHQKRGRPVRRICAV